MATKEEIQKLVDEKNNTDPDWFCPLIKDKCRKDCWCFQKSYLQASGGVYSEASYCQAGFQCTNDMFGA
jgi:hypothetical protein